MNLPTSQPYRSMTPASNLPFACQTRRAERLMVCNAKAPNPGTCCHLNLSSRRHAIRTAPRRKSEGHLRSKLLAIQHACAHVRIAQIGRYADYTGGAERAASDGRSQRTD